MNSFIVREIKNLKMLRLCAVIFLIINFVIIGYLIYCFYDVYNSRRIAESFILYAGKTVLLLQLCLLIFFLPFLLIIHLRFRFARKCLSELNNFFSGLYESYCKCRPRFFSEIPKYIISQDGLMILGNFRQLQLKEEDYNKIVIKRIDMGRLGRRCIVKFYHSSRKIASISYDRLYPEEVDFLLANIYLINADVDIIDK